MSDDIFLPWSEDTAQAWNRRPIRLSDRLHLESVFQHQALAALIERYPREDYALVMTSGSGQKHQRWREGDMAHLPGQQVMDTIARGRLWLNLREVHRHDAVMAELLQQAYSEIAQRIPGFKATSLKMGLLISSPGAQVHYHCDLPGQLLWQIQGKKRVWVYPPEPPFLQPQWLEDIAYTGFEFSLVYDPAFERDAVVFDLEPGQMLCWPLNAPHRVENEDCLNVSVTTEHWTVENRRQQKVHLAHAVMRHRLGWSPTPRHTRGVSYWGKAALQAAWRRSPWAKGVQQAMRPVEFELSQSAPGGYVELADRR